MMAWYSVPACELKNKLDARATALAAAVAVACVLAAAPLLAASQPDHAPPKTEQPAPGVAAEPDDHAAEEEHHSVWAGLLWPTVNFAILFGILWYFLKSPIANHLRDRHALIRKDLVEAANMKAAASAELDEIDRKLRALPSEIDALRNRGAEEIAAEETRIAALAAAERERLLEQTRREIDLQLRLAKRDLVAHAANLAVQLAGERIERQMTPSDQEHLVDDYLRKVKAEGSTDTAGHPQSGRP